MIKKIHNSKDVLDILRSVRHKYFRIETLQEREERARDRAEKGYGYSVSAGHGDGIGDGAAALADVEDSLKVAIQEYKDAELKAEELIRKIQDRRTRLIIYDRYCQMCSWPDIVRRYDMTRYEILHIEHVAAKEIYRKVYKNENNC